MPTTNKIRLVVALLGILALAPRAAMAGDRDDNPRLAQESDSRGDAKKPAISNPPDREAAPAAASDEGRRPYRLSLGRWWSTKFSVPEWLDILDITDRIRGFVGMFAILGAAVFLSDNRRAISRRVVFWGLALQWALALLVLRVPAGAKLLAGAGKLVESILNCALAGARFVFGDALSAPTDRPVLSLRFESCPPSFSLPPCSPSCTTWA